MKLIMSNKYQVDLINENSMQEFEVLFHGPKDSYYEGVSRYHQFANHSAKNLENDHFLDQSVSNSHQTIRFNLYKTQFIQLWF